MSSYRTWPRALLDVSLHECILSRQVEAEIALRAAPTKTTPQNLLPYKAQKSTHLQLHFRVRRQIVGQGEIPTFEHDVSLSWKHQDLEKQCTGAAGARDAQRMLREYRKKCNNKLTNPHCSNNKRVKMTCMSPHLYRDIDSISSRGDRASEWLWCVLSGARANAISTALFRP